jgi:hypothetical protein
MGVVDRGCIGAVVGMIKDIEALNLKRYPIAFAEAEIPGDIGV